MINLYGHTRLNEGTINFGSGSAWMLPPPPSSTLLTDIQGYYKFDETSGTNSADSVGSIDGTMSSGAVASSDGKINYGVNIVAASSRVDMGNNYAFDSNDTFSFSCWVKRGTLGAGEATIFSKMMNGSPNQGYQFNFRSSGEVDFYLISTTSGTNYLRAQATNLAITDTTTWHHIVLTYTGNSAGSGIKIYVDNVEATINTAPDNLSGTIVNTTTFKVGTRSTNGLTGRIDELGIWSKVLTQSEVTELYNSGAGNQYPF